MFQTERQNGNEQQATGLAGLSATLLAGALTVGAGLFSTGCSSSVEPDQSAAVSLEERATPPYVTDEVLQAVLSEEFSYQSFRRNSSYTLSFSTENGRVEFPADRSSDALRYHRRIHPDVPAFLPDPEREGVSVSNPEYQETEFWRVKLADLPGVEEALQEALAERDRVVAEDFERLCDEIVERVPHFSLRKGKDGSSLGDIRATDFGLHGARYELKLYEDASGDVRGAVLLRSADDREGLLDIRELSPEIAAEVVLVIEKQLQLVSDRQAFYESLQPASLFEMDLKRDAEGILVTRGALSAKLIYEPEVSSLSEEFPEYRAEVQIEGCPWRTGHSDQKAKLLYRAAEMILDQREGE
jgi:hypothetical protein